MKKILSFGGGVQTVAVSVMSAFGDLPKPDISIFADTQWESQSTYEYIEWFSKWMKKHGMELRCVTAGNIRADSLSNQRFASIPFRTKNPDGSIGMLRRQCTNEYKIVPVYKQLRKYIGLEKWERMKGEVELWMGISLDEVHRMKTNRVKWIKNTYPLIDKRITRHDCIEYLKKKQIPVPPKSACLGCPFHSDSYWQKLKEQYSSEWDNVVEYDNAMRRHKVSIRSPVYIHRSCMPLSEVVFNREPDLFGEECDGMCGV